MLMPDHALISVILVHPVFGAFAHSLLQHSCLLTQLAGFRTRDEERGEYPCSQAAPSLLRGVVALSADMQRDGEKATELSQHTVAPPFE